MTPMRSDLWINATLVVISLLLFTIAMCTTYWQMYAWRTPATFNDTAYPHARRKASAPGYPARSGDFPIHSFSLIMPCREEPEAVMRATIDKLLAQDHPDFEIIISVGHDDTEPQQGGLSTKAVAFMLAAEHPDKIRVSVDTSPVGTKNKPKQLNAALPMCTKEMVGIIDAESLTHPSLLTHIDITFQREDADVVQGSVHLVNYKATWFSLRNCLEYRTWFRSRLHGHARSGFIPLGGNTVFTKRYLLVEIGGWDGNCLAEDCDMGVRLSTLGKKIVCAYDAQLTTQEEAPTEIRALIKQRTRWALGFMQVLAKGDWKRLPTRRQRFLAFWTLVQQHAMAFAGLALPIAIASAFLLDLPPVVVLITFLPAIPTIVMVAWEVLILQEFGSDMHFKIRRRDYVVMVVSTPVYQFLLAASSIRAFYKFTRKDFAWEKTSHTGSHIGLQTMSSQPVEESA